MSAAAYAEDPRDITYLHPGQRDSLTPTPRVPIFDGQTVDRYEVKISGVATLDDHEHAIPVVSLDDRVRVVGGYRVTKVIHYLDDKTGEVVRQSTLSPMSAEICPWDPSNPADDGVVRAPKG
jgi:hypothetical protein